MRRPNSTFVAFRYDFSSPLEHIHRHLSEDGVRTTFAVHF